MKAHLIDTHLLVSRSFAKVKVKYQGHVSQKMGVLGALVFHKHNLFRLNTYVWLFIITYFRKNKAGDIPALVEARTDT